MWLSLCNNSKDSNFHSSLKKSTSKGRGQGCVEGGGWVLHQFVYEKGIKHQPPTAVFTSWHDYYCCCTERCLTLKGKETYTQFSF